MFLHWLPLFVTPLHRTAPFLEVSVEGRDEVEEFLRRPREGEFELLSVLVELLDLEGTVAGGGAW